MVIPLNLHYKTMLMPCHTQIWHPNHQYHLPRETTYYTTKNQSLKFIEFTLYQDRDLATIVQILKNSIANH